MQIDHPRHADSACLEAKELSCIRDDRILFEGLEFKLQAGEMLLLEGRNGSGKTSLLRILCSIRLADEGSVVWCGEDIQKLGADYHQHIAYIGHRDGIKLDLTPLENLHVARALGKASATLDSTQVLERFGLYGFEDIPTYNLSAGQQRRLALSRLLATESQLWILDEPFTSLDKHGIQQFERLMEDHLACAGMIVLTTHHKVDLDGSSVHYINLSA
ncbi:MAG: cytochrome c biogenesis heme-transporting ATPase CcmA [Pseudomonadota bacterium]